MYVYQAKADSMISQLDALITKLQDLKENSKTAMNSIVDNPDVFAQYVVKNNDVIADEYDKVIDKIQSAESTLKTRAKEMDDELEAEERRRREEAQRASTERSDNVDAGGGCADYITLDGD